MNKRTGLWLLAGLAPIASFGSGCGSGPSNSVLSVRVASGIGRDAKDERFTLRCNPTGGDMPNRTALCKMIRDHPAAMLDPGQARSTCVGSAGVPPSVWVSGRSRGHRVRLNARVMCEWPGGVGALAYWAAVDVPHFLPVAALRLHCDDDPDLQKAPIRWARIRECLSKVPPHWKPPSSG
jgi:hypothetical protein